jgi:multiple sugar transport system permease protein
MSTGRKILLYSILIIISITTIFPFLWMLSSSFKTMGEIFALTPSFIPAKLFQEGMWDNYKTILNEYNFIRFIINSFLVAGLAALGQLFTCSLGGFAFARMEFRGKEVIFALMLATMMMPIQVTIIPEYFIMLKLDWYNTYLPLIVPSILIGSFGTFLFRSTFENMPSSMEEAAFIDGVSDWQMYYRVFLPNAKPSLASLFIIAFMNNWNALLRPVIYIDKPELYTVTMGLAMFKGNYGTQWHLLLAGSVLSILPILLVYMSMQKYFVRGMLTSGTKG